ncbi:MAG: ferrous iron transport protein A [Oscillospiraceae bacterium]|nr:ferrous iron transport protein A [Oscillospiraceae bacterium]MBR2739332.1 ferrous iron transport protein A [Oscillospiraceae bacterium]
MMPLGFATTGEDNVIQRVGGNPEMKKHLEDMGFVTGGIVRVVAEMGGNLIVDVKDTRIAISREMAQKIMI